MKYIAVLFFFLLCGYYVSGKLRTDIVDDANNYYKTVRLHFYGYTKKPTTWLWIPPLVYIKSEGSRENLECYYYDNRYITVELSIDSRVSNINANIKLKNGVSLEGRIIAEQYINDSIQIDFHFPLSCADMQDAILYLTDADKELLVITTYY